MKVRDLGLIEYSKALEVQNQTWEEVFQSGEGVLLVCEHPLVATVGRALGSQEEVLDPDLQVFEVSRGGRSTLHLPGQVVVYPILDLKKADLDLHGYLRDLEEAIINTLGDFCIQGQRIEGKTGVWVEPSRLGPDPHKVASLGIAVKKWITYHGIALNVACDLSQFSKIKPCGFSAEVMTSMAYEMSDEYRNVWKIEKSDLFSKVKHRLVENLREVLDK